VALIKEKSFIKAVFVSLHSYESCILCKTRLKLYKTILNDLKQ